MCKSEVEIMSMLEVKNIRKSFGSTKVLNDISFSMEKGEVVSIIGSSGSGKSTLLRCMNYLETPDAGQILLNGETILDMENPATRRSDVIRKNRLHFGLVFQNFNLFPQYTAKENVKLALTLQNQVKEDYKEKKADYVKQTEDIAVTLLHQMGLADRMDNYPHQLSGGQQQRVAIARALALSPDIVCFDEPTSALDPELTGEVLKVIKELAATTTMVIVTHEMEFARDVSTKVIFMDNGYILEQGSPQELFTNPKNARTREFLKL